MSLSPEYVSSIHPPQRDRQERAYCLVCHEAMVFEIDGIGRVIEVHPPSRCTPAKPRFYGDCSVCGREVKLREAFHPQRVILCSKRCQSTFWRDHALAESLTRIRKPASKASLMRKYPNEEESK